MCEGSKGDGQRRPSVRFAIMGAVLGGAALTWPMFKDGFVALPLQAVSYVPQWLFLAIYAGLGDNSTFFS